MMDTTIKVFCENSNTSLYVKMGTSLAELLDILALKSPFPSLAAYVNNSLKELTYRIFEPVTIRFIDITHFEGQRVYQRTLFFIMQKAVYDLYPEHKLSVRHSIAKGFYAEIDGFDGVPQEVVDAIKARMQQIIKQDISIIKTKMPENEAAELYKQFGLEDKVALLETRHHLYVTVYMLADLPGFFYGALCPSTKMISLFDIEPFYKGIYIRVPSNNDPTQLEQMVPQDKMFEIISLHKQWSEILGVANIGSLNKIILENKSKELIQIAEALQEKVCANVADMIFDKYNQEGSRIILLSGPSSSGKTTTSKRIAVQLSVLGFEPMVISLDDYFLNRECTPRDENGEYDFEALEALDIEQFNKDLLALLDGEEVNIPTYDFVTGCRVMNPEKRLRLKSRSMLIIEGIHALNPSLTPHIKDTQKFKIYVSALTSIAMDNMNRIATTDNRLLRRMVRDNAYRGTSAVDTIKRWQSVRRGEDKHIFPYQEQADVVINSAMIYELCVLKRYAETILHEVPDSVPEFGEANRLLKFLEHFAPIDSDFIPPTSVLREFIGGSSFVY
jgi:uridine kinase